MADFLDETFGEAPQAEPPVEPEIVAPESEPVTEAPAPEPVPEPQPKEEKSIPLGTFLDMRDKAREAERRAAELEARLKPASDVPDPYDDPDAYRQYVNNDVQAQVTNLKFQMSDQMARQVHGADTVDKAAEWATERAKSNPAFAAAYMREPHPIDWIVREHKRDSIYSQLPTDVSSLDEYIEREIAKRSQTAPPAAASVPVVAATAPKPAPPPRSIASDVTAPNAPVLDEGASFEAIFRK